MSTRGSSRHELLSVIESDMAHGRSRTRLRNFERWSRVCSRLQCWRVVAGKGHAHLGRGADMAVLRAGLWRARGVWREPSDAL